ncbi:NAD(P)-dependent oxidoreductase [Roseibium sp. DSM 29163]|uniref:NAD(P)-dependent oxidoreductase n=2 Tax=Roseibium salinum TaxID=1604349 RepID=A0ABT3QW68_9HYPH|nr:NAD(P)-dependent oxidoreductase [Roseibium sp. DSM 29163]
MNSDSIKSEKVGFVGVGLMGHGMAKNIVEMGYKLTTIAHRNRTPVDDLVSRGASEAGTLAELAATSTMIFICLTDSDAIESVVTEMKPALTAGTIIVDCSTANPSSTERIAAELAPLGVGYADAPLGGTPKEAEAGALHAMIGCSEDVFARVEPVLSACTAKIVHLGKLGDGHRMKLLNNFLSLGYGALYAEALALSRKVGISVETFDSVVRGSRMDCGFYQTFMGYALEGNRAAHKFTLSNAYKDMKYVESMANDVQFVTAMSSAVKNSYAFGITNGGSGDDDYVPHLTDFIARANGL